MKKKYIAPKTKMHKLANNNNLMEGYIKMNKIQSYSIDNEDEVM